MSNFSLILVLIALVHFGTSIGSPHGGSYETESRHGDYMSRGTFPLAKKRAAEGADSATTGDLDLLDQLKLMAYEQKLKDQQTKAKAKADAKAAKEKAKAAQQQAMLMMYLNSINSSSTVATRQVAAPYPLLYPTVGAPGSIMPMPMVPAIGLWKKQMWLSQLYGAMAAQQAAAAAAAAATTTTPDSIVQVHKRDALAARKDQVINQITKRYARYLRKKHGDEGDEKKYKHGKKNEESDEDEDDYEDSGASNSDNDDEIPFSSLSGASNKFGTAPGGNSPVAQAGCSGSHIHVCSGTTFYLNSPENIKSQGGATNLPEDLKTDDSEETDKQLRKYKSYSEWNKSWKNNDADEDEDRHKKSKKRGHRSRKHKKHGHKYESEKKSNEDDQDQEESNEKDVEDEPAAAGQVADEGKTA